METNTKITVEIDSAATTVYDAELMTRVGWATMNLALSAHDTMKADEAFTWGEPVDVPQLIVRVRPFEWLSDNDYHVGPTNERLLIVGDFCVTGEMVYADSGVGEVPVIRYGNGDYGFDI